MTTMQDFSQQGLLVKPDSVPEIRIQLDPIHDPGLVVLGGGCFWCIDLLFRQLRGVQSVISGYSGGDANKAHYRDVTTGQSGHIEVVQVDYDPELISFNEILRVFFLVAHNPTQKDGQGPDIGPHYRSVIFCTNTQQMLAAQTFIRELDSLHVFGDPIVTRVETLKSFYPAEQYHQDYANKHPHQPYVRQVAEPKLQKLERYFDSLLD